MPADDANVTVRPARADDAEAIRAVGSASWHAAYDSIHGPETVESLFEAWWTLEDLRAGAENPDRRLLVAARAREVCGVVDASPHPGQEGVFRIARLYIHPEERGEGFGTRLVDRLRERLPDETRTLRLVVLAENGIGTSFYESYGSSASGAGSRKSVARPARRSSTRSRSDPLRRTGRRHIPEAAMVPDMVPEPSSERGCPKCGHSGTDVGKISTTGGGLSKMFDIQTNSFKVVSCTNCGYSELYRDTTSGSSDIVDIFLG